jgi:hypothetical protein
LSDRFEQGDQIGRIFAQRATDTFGQLFEKYLSSTNFLTTFSYFFSYDLILTKLSWATSWAIVAQTHPVTLVLSF